MHVWELSISRILVPNTLSDLVRSHSCGIFLLGNYDFWSQAEPNSSLLRFTNSSTTLNRHFIILAGAPFPPECDWQLN